nr:immunoglobulin light chain junction region [Macaca mulatta]MPN95415.1 immunoglobulin light chain junction region [Macaca mulatta]
WQHYYSTPYSF